MAEDLGKHEVEFAMKRPLLERQRQAAIVSAQAALPLTKKYWPPSLPRQQKRRAEATAKLEADLKAYESTTFAKKMADWEKEKSSIDPQSLAGRRAQDIERDQRVDLTKQPDGSILVSGPNRNGVVTMTAETELAGITGMRLEVLTDNSLPQKGPGRANDGNFVLNEIELIAAPKADPKQVNRSSLQMPWPISVRIISRSPRRSTAAPTILATAGPFIRPPVSPTGRRFETTEPVGAVGGTILTFKLHHKFAKAWTLGRFRLSVTRGSKPIGLSLPEDFRAVLATSPEVRTDAQRSHVDDLFTRYRPGIASENRCR